MKFYAVDARVEAFAPFRERRAGLVDRRDWRTDFARRMSRRRRGGEVDAPRRKARRSMFMILGSRGPGATAEAGSHQSEKCAACATHHTGQTSVAPGGKVVSNRSNSTSSTCSRKCGRCITFDSPQEPRVTKPYAEFRGRSVRRLTPLPEIFRKSYVMRPLRQRLGPSAGL